MEPRRVDGRRRPDVRRRLLVVGGLAGFVVTVYVTVVLGGGALIGRTDSPSVLLSVLATAAVALLLAPVQAALERAATRRGYGSGDTPYDVLSSFSGTVTASYPAEEWPARMAMELARGTGAQWAQVWLAVHGRLVLVATWPVDAVADRSPPDVRRDAGGAVVRARRTATVRHDGRVLGVLRLQERPGPGLTAVEERLLAGLADRAGLVLRQMGLRAELEERHDELVARAADLKASRERLIRAQDQERRRLERDIHDGAQQHLVALAVNLRLAQAIAVRSPQRAARLLSDQADAASVAVDTLASLSRGIYPRLLAEEGLVPALRSALATSPLPVSIDSGDVGRLPAQVEAALYFCCMEAVQNATKHSQARTVAVHVVEDEAGWTLTVVDDGVGFGREGLLAPGTGTGLTSMRDRLDALGGTVTVASAPGSGTTVSALLPRTGQPEERAPARASSPRRRE